LIICVGADISVHRQPYRWCVPGFVYQTWHSNGSWRRRQQP